MDNKVKALVREKVQKYLQERSNQTINKNEKELLDKIAKRYKSLKGDS